MAYGEVEVVLATFCATSELVIAELLARLNNDVESVFRVAAICLLAAFLLSSMVSIQ